MTVTVRRARPEDEAELFALARTFPTPTPPGIDAFRTAFHGKLGDDASAVIVAERGSRLIGYVSGSRHLTFYASGPTAWVDEILVAAEARGAGIGQRLMHAFETWAGGDGCVLVALATAGAAGFYERLGYASRAGYFKKYLAPSSPATPAKG